MSMPSFSCPPQLSPVQARSLQSNGHLHDGLREQICERATAATKCATTGAATKSPPVPMRIERAARRHRRRPSRKEWPSAMGVYHAACTDARGTGPPPVAGMDASKWQFTLFRLLMRIQTNLFEIDNHSIAIYPSAWLCERACLIRAPGPPHRERRPLESDEVATLRLLWNGSTEGW